MTIRFLIYSLLILVNCLSQANIPHASIAGWMPGSYGNYRVSYQRPPLPIYVRITFDQSVTDEFINKFFRFLTTTINQSLASLPIHFTKHKLGGYCITLQPSITRNHFQILLDQANHYFDPNFKTAQEIIQHEKQEKIKLENDIEIERKHKLEQEQHQKETAKLKKQADEIKNNKLAAEQLKLAMKKPTVLIMFHNAIIDNSVINLRKAIALGALINCGKDGRSSLLWAVLLKRTNIVEELLKLGANVNVIYLEKTLVEHAIALNALEIASLLIKAGANDSGYKITICQYLKNELSNAIREDSPEKIKGVIRLGANIHENALSEAISLNKYKAVDELIKQGVKFSNISFMQVAMKWPYFEIALLLLKKGADFYGDIPDQHQPISIVARAIMCYSTKEDWGNDFIKTIIARGYDINNKEYLNNLWYLSFQWAQGNVNLINLLIQSKLNINQIIDTNDLVPETYWTPLFLGIYCQNTEIIKLLLKSGANINQKAKPSTHPFYNKAEPLKVISPLGYATSTGRSAIAELLIKHGAIL